MAILPERYAALIGFLQSHAEVWEQHPGAIGLSEQQVEQVALAADRARDAYRAAQEARNAAEAATWALKNALGDTRSAASTAIDAIKLHARVSGQGNSVYTAAKIPPPESPSALPPPGLPRYTGCELDQFGALTIRWRCKQPRGSRNVTYLVQRRTPGRAWQFLGATGVRHFTDETLPAGSPWAEYTITARRGSRQGSICVCRVNLGAVMPAAAAARAA